MKGLDLAEAYYRAHGVSMLENKFAAFVPRIAVGSVGPGSECFGFDDDISRDHDWGPAFCIWVTAADHKKTGGKIQEAYKKLPPVFKGFGPRAVSPGEEFRTGVCEIGAFYRTYTGRDRPPESLREWLYIPEQSLAICTNGRIFTDPLGEFSRWREALLNFYPEDVRLKKIASRCFTIAQAGQYNFVRSLKRKELFALHHAETSFCTDVISLIFLLNRRYAPFYKWMHHAVQELSIQGETVHTMISDLISRIDYDEKQSIIEEICALIIGELKSEGLSNSESDFLLDHAYDVHEKIQDRELRKEFSLTN
jgi:hypothetical protein